MEACAPFQENPDIEPKHVKVYRIKEVVFNRLEPLRFPLAEHRVNMRRIGDTVPCFDPLVVPCPLPSSSSVPAPGNGEQPEDDRTDKRGQGGTALSGRVTRPYKGSTRPPNIDPDVWNKMFTLGDKRKAVEEYLDSLVSEEDHKYLQDEEMARAIAELGYR